MNINLEAEIKDYINYLKCNKEAAFKRFSYYLKTPNRKVSENYWGAYYKFLCDTVDDLEIILEGESDE